MELRHLRYFVAVAEELNFTRAAARLGIGQPPLSQQIKDLEAELQVLLFRRVPHGAELTEAGTTFLQECRRVLAAADHATISAQRAARGEFGHLRIGFTGSSHFHTIVPTLIRDFARSYPEVSLRLEEAHTMRLMTALTRGDLDIAFTHSAIEGAPELAFHLIEEEPLIAVLPHEHRLAADATVRVADLRDDLFILMPPHLIGPALNQEVIGACRKAGFDPKRGQEAPQIATVISLVSAELGVSLVPRALRQIQAAGAVFRPIEDVATRVALLLVCRKHERSSAARNFVALARASVQSPAQNHTG